MTIIEYLEKVVAEGKGTLPVGNLITHAELLNLIKTGEFKWGPILHEEKKMIFEKEN